MSTPLNLMDPAVRANPYPFYAELRRMPVQQVEPGGMWAVSRHDDVIAAFKDPRLSVSANLQIFQPSWLEQNLFAHTLLSMDPPKHTQMRAMVSHLFTAAGLAWMEARAQFIADVLAAKLVQRREVDIVNDWAMALPGHVIGDMLGLPAHLHPRIKQWADMLASIPILQPNPDEIARVKTELSLMERVLRELVESRRHHPGDDLVTELMKAKVEGRAIQDDELVAFCGLLMVAGVETTTHLLTNSMLILAERPDIFERVRAERGRLIPRFIEEVLRFEPPAQAAVRFAIAPIEIGGVQIPPGAMVALLIGSAAHDEQHFPDPEQFRLDREEPSHIAFGHGHHFCLGAVLARMETRFGLESIVLHVNGLSRKPQALQWIHSLNMRGLVSLPMSFEPK